MQPESGRPWQTVIGQQCQPCGVLRFLMAWWSLRGGEYSPLPTPLWQLRNSNSCSVNQSTAYRSRSPLGVCCLQRGNIGLRRMMRAIWTYHASNDCRWQRSIAAYARPRCKLASLCFLRPPYFRYSESFFKSSGIGGNGGHSWPAPLSRLTAASERAVPSCTTNVWGCPSAPLQSETPA